MKFVIPYYQTRQHYAQIFIQTTKDSLYFLQSGYVAYVALHSKEAARWYKLIGFKTQHTKVISSEIGKLLIIGC
jgi:hypothetical protein